MAFSVAFSVPAATPTSATSMPSSWAPRVRPAPCSPTEPLLTNDAWAAPHRAVPTTARRLTTSCRRGGRRARRTSTRHFAGTSMATPHVAGAVADVLATGLGQQGAVARSCLGRQGGLVWDVVRRTAGCVEGRGWSCDAAAARWSRYCPGAGTRWPAAGTAALRSFAPALAGRAERLGNAADLSRPDLSRPSSVVSILSVWISTVSRWMRIPGGPRDEGQLCLPRTAVQQQGGP